ncbi:putative NBD/HSP70 family sugar kinase [Murinocardiopsis flavida]|uniref:Putative NBD/HSP70 family sugar kinase n=1 Tax=Murinocardiopsis flavida TaxID=645275 RepID=A0A2P8DUW1_9ACTN|nr:ROK family transcriptional regulator [Murinocardiopsis flavida]PSL00995.1 putative NBD/HSP70 family sugar kinase [Murinocardiopsis flavida]
MSRRPGTPRLLRQLNDRAALDLLVTSGPLTRTQIGEATGLSKVTASQLLARLEEREFVHVVGTQAGGRGPNAALYAVVPSSAYVAALDISIAVVTAVIADITGEIVAEVSFDPMASPDPVAVVHKTVMSLVERAAVPLDRLEACVIGTPGVVDPRTGDVRFSFDFDSWHEGVLGALRTDLRRAVIIENDVNLAAVAEHAEGAAKGTPDFALLWFGEGGGVGMAVMLGDRIHRGRSGGAGEIGYLPVPGAPLPGDVGLHGGYQSLRSAHGIPRLAHGFQALVGAKEIVALGIRHGLNGTDAPDMLTAARAAGMVTAARSAGERGTAFLDELAERIARGVAAVCVVLDPGVVVLGGLVPRAGGTDLSQRVADATRSIGPNAPEVEVSSVDGNPVLRGAVLAALKRARDDVFASTVD